MVKGLRDLKELPLETVPDTLQGELRPYQQLGMSWLLFLRQYGFGGCLADDMGLGKTVQLIAYLLKVKETETAQDPLSLFVRPLFWATGKKNWSASHQIFRVHLHYGSNRFKSRGFYENS